MKPHLHTLCLFLLYCTYTSLLPAQSTFFNLYDIATLEPQSISLASDREGNRLMGYYGLPDFTGLIKTDAMGKLLWHKSYVAAGTDRILAIVTTDSTYLLVGHTESPQTDSQEGLLIVTDYAGDPVESFRFDRNEGRDRFEDILPLPDGFLLVGSSEVNGVGQNEILRLDENYQVLWNRSFGLASGFGGAYHVQITSDGGFLVAGGLETTSTSRLDIYLLKIDSQGNKVWSQTYGSEKGDSPQSIVELPDHGFLVGGSSFGLDASFPFPQGFLLRIDSIGNEVFTHVDARLQTVASILPLQDGNFIISGASTASPVNAVPDNVIEKIRPDGTSMWLKYYGEFSSDRAQQLELQPDGGILSASVYFESGKQKYQPTLALADTSGRVGCQDTSYQPVIFQVTPTISTVNESITMGIEKYPISIITQTLFGADSLKCCQQNFDMNFDFNEINPLEIAFYSTAPSSGITYMWDFGDGSTSTDADPVHTYAATGTYTVCLTISSSCGTQAECLPVTVTAVNRQEEADWHLSLFPNPTYDRLFIRWEENPQPKEWAIYSAQGRLLKGEKVPHSTNKIGIAVQDLAAGLYFLRLKNDLTHQHFTFRVDHP